MKQIEFILYVSNQQASRDFYAEVLKLEPSLDVPGMTEFTLADSCKLGLMLEAGIAGLLGHKTVHPSRGSGIPRCELYLSVDDVKECFNRAVNAGAKGISSPAVRDWGDIAGYVSDPDGHIVAFARKM
jgi:uncharacterized glyoxalase superfamily protein PhnB